MTQMNLKGIHALVVGMKKSGVAAAALLARQGAVVRGTDLQPLDQLPGVRELNIPFAQQTPEVFESADLIVLSPDVPADLAPLVDAIPVSAENLRASAQTHATTQRLPATGRWVG